LPLFGIVDRLMAC